MAMMSLPPVPPAIAWVVASPEFVIGQNTLSAGGDFPIYINYTCRGSRVHFLASVFAKNENASLEATIGGLRVPKYEAVVKSAGEKFFEWDIPNDRLIPGAQLIVSTLVRQSASPNRLALRDQTWRLPLPAPLCQ